MPPRLSMRGARLCDEPPVLVPGRLVELATSAPVLVHPQIEVPVEAGALPRPDVPGHRVEHVHPVLRTDHEEVVRPRVVETRRQPRDRVLQHPGRREVALAVLDHAGGEVLVGVRAGRLRRGQHLRGDHRSERRPAVVVGRAHVVQGGDDHLEVVALHPRHLRRPRPSLFGEQHDRVVDVAGDAGERQSDELHLTPVHVPAGPGEILVEVPAALDPVDLAVVAEVRPVDVVADVGVQERVVEAGVELGALLVGAAVDPDRAERPPPQRRRPHRAESALSTSASRFSAALSTLTKLRPVLAVTKVIKVPVS